MFRLSRIDMNVDSGGRMCRRKAVESKEDMPRKDSNDV